MIAEYAIFRKDFIQKLSNIKNDLKEVGNWFVYLRKNKPFTKMGYSNFRKIETVSKQFGVSVKREALFGKIKTLKPSAWLLQTLKLARLFPLRNEKVKSERVVSP